jgi:hypothetical protein
VHCDTGGATRQVVTAPAARPARAAFAGTWPGAGWAKELNANFVRLAHYPHNEHMARGADELLVGPPESRSLARFDN